ncbi:MAG TPA: hypothetical protein VHB69_13235 [Mycobacteriales bacterium]|nr:hypothetical protein [Mycobacteriales bacterium]
MGVVCAVVGAALGCVVTVDLGGDFTVEVDVEVDVVAPPERGDTVLALWVGAVAGLTAEEPVEEAVDAAGLGRTRAGRLVVVSDLGGEGAAEVRVAGNESDVPGSADAELAGASSATAIVPAPSAAPTPVSAVTRRTLRRTRSRCETADARLAASMTSRCSPSLRAA